MSIILLKILLLTTFLMICVAIPKIIQLFWIIYFQILAETGLELVLMSFYTFFSMSIALVKV